MKTLCTLFSLLLLSFGSDAQVKDISGAVTSSSDGLPLPGVSIIVKGTATGTQTDFDGNYTIKAAQGNTLVFSYVGMKTKEIVVTNTLIINVALEEDSNVLEEVVVTAYGTSTSKALTGSVASVRIRGAASLSPAQIKRQKQKVYHDKLHKQLTLSDNEGTGTKKISLKDQPLYIVDGMPINKAYNEIIEGIADTVIDSKIAYSSAEAKRKFGRIAKNGCIVITTIQGNYRVENDEAYASIHENDFKRTTLAPLSTFSIDVDKASYSNIRRMINNGQAIPSNAVKIEEMVNYFNYNYPQPKSEHPFSINTEVVTTPWHKDTQLVRIGLQGKTYENDALPPSNLTFLIDVSGSMSDSNKLPLLKSAFKLLVNQLREKDKVAIVVYAGAAGVVLEPTSGHKKEAILNALDKLQAGGSTAGGAGIELAYKLAQKHFKKNGNNRVILATDGDFNVGASSDKAMEKLIEEKRQSGVFLSVLGFGYGNYKDSKLETLADKGNGNHAYIDTMQEAQKVFGKEFGGTLYTIAKDVKIQLEFNPNKVQAYRLIGYENRLLNDEDFVDDTKDAGELGSSHKVTALYEIIPAGVTSDYLQTVSDLKYTPKNSSIGYSDELFTVKFRYKKPDADKSIELEHVQNTSTTEVSEDMNFASAVALFGMHLRQSKYDNEATLNDVISLANKGRGKDKQGYRAEFIRLVKSYEDLQ